jgi:hypothetical protein
MFHASQRVRRGAELLDRHRPGWEREVDIERLHMGNTVDCLLGQLYGDYESGWDTLGLWEPVERSAHGFNHGFYVYWPWQAPVFLWMAQMIGFDRTLRRYEWQVLRDAWLAEIRARRQANAAGLRLVGELGRTRDVPVGIDYSTEEC